MYTTNGLFSSSRSARRKQAKITPYLMQSTTHQLTMYSKPTIIHALYIRWLTIECVLACQFVHHVLFQTYLLTPTKSPIFSPSKWQRTEADASLQHSASFEKRPKSVFQSFGVSCKILYQSGDRKLSLNIICISYRSIDPPFQILIFFKW